MVETNVEVAVAPAVADARSEYERRVGLRRSVVEGLVKNDRVIADVRLTVFASALVVAFVAWRWSQISLAWAMVPIVGYVALVLLHEQNRKRLRRARRAVAFYEKGLAKIDGTWAGTGVRGDRFLSEEHLYAADLDLFGSGSLFERLCSARTTAGEDRLAGWLMAPSSPAEIRERQVAVGELRPMTDLREDLELMGSEVREGIDAEALAAWGLQPAVFRSNRPRVVAGALALLGTQVPVAFAVTNFGLSFLCFVVLLDVGYWMIVKRRVLGVLAPLRKRTADLVVLSELLRRLESQRFAAIALIQLKGALESDGQPASRQIARLARLLTYLDAKHNQFFAPIAGLLNWSPQFAISIDEWRARQGPKIVGWLKAVGEFEALISLAAYSFENPADPFAEVVEGPAFFEGEGMGHPLVPLANCVRNDVSLGGELRFLLVSGSNMSGKSTLLRTVGANAVLALAGCPVRAVRLRTSVLSVGATLRIQDSLQAGRSRFYAEISRIKRLVETAEGPTPLLFLLDEVFHGTNSRDRVIGAGAVIEGLIDRGAIGLVTTHDLALVDVANRLAPRSANVHFQDELVDGLMRFDYAMRPGVVTHSNALALMRAVGLEV